MSTLPLKPDTMNHKPDVISTIEQDIQKLEYKLRDEYNNAIKEITKKYQKQYTDLTISIPTCNIQIKITRGSTMYKYFNVKPNAIYTATEVAIRLQAKKELAIEASTVKALSLQSTITQPTITQPIITQPIITQPIITQPRLKRPRLIQPILTQSTLIQLTPIQELELVLYNEFVDWIKVMRNDTEMNMVIEEKSSYTQEDNDNEMFYTITMKHGEEWKHIMNGEHIMNITGGCHGFIDACIDIINQGFESECEHVIVERWYYNIILLKNIITYKCMFKLKNGIVVKEISHSK